MFVVDEFGIADISPFFWFIWFGYIASFFWLGDVWLLCTDLRRGPAIGLTVNGYRTVTDD